MYFYFFSSVVNWSFVITNVLLPCCGNCESIQKLYLKQPGTRASQKKKITHESLGDLACTDTHSPGDAILRFSSPKKLGLIIGRARVLQGCHVITTLVSNLHEMSR